MSYPPPPAPPPGPPLGAAPEQMPGSTKAAVVLLWVMFGLGICGGGAAALGYTALTAMEEQGDAIIPSSYLTFMIIGLVQALVWTVLRGVFAVQIAKRKARARMGAIILEAAGVVISVVSYFVTPDIEMTGQSTAANTAGAVVGMVLGLAVAAIIVGLLSTANSKQWCNE